MSRVNILDISEVRNILNGSKDPIGELNHMAPINCAFGPLSDHEIRQGCLIVWGEVEWEVGGQFPRPNAKIWHCVVVYEETTTGSKILTQSWVNVDTIPRPHKTWNPPPPVHPFP